MVPPNISQFGQSRKMTYFESLGENAWLTFYYLIFSIDDLSSRQYTEEIVSRRNVDVSEVPEKKNIMNALHRPFLYFL